MAERVPLAEVSGEQPCACSRIAEYAVLMLFGQWDEKREPLPMLHKRRVIEGHHRVAAARLAGRAKLLFV